MQNDDRFSFLQIRPNQEYDATFFVMLYPNEISILKMSKEQILSNIDAGHFKPQHGGKTGNSGTYCYYGEKKSLLMLGATVVI